MQYRKFGKSDWEVSILGFGAMRLPVLNKNQSEINKPEASRMIRQAIDAGVNYLDTAYIYHNGQSEPFLGEVLKDGYREKVKLATKLPPWFIQSADDFDKILNEQLKKLQTETIDCYLLHGLNKTHWPMLRDLGVLEWAEKAKADGRISHLGFSFHDHIDLFKEILEAYDKWEFCQIQYNYMDTDFQAGREGLELAAKKGLGVIVMEPLRGGQLVHNLPESVQELWEKAPLKRSLADWALQWVWNQPAVTTVLSGMTAMNHLQENLISADKATIGGLTAAELEIVEQVCAEYQKTNPIPCTACKYCVPCQANVDIPEIFQRYNDAFRYQDLKQAQHFYNSFLSQQQADRCEECYECEDHCPQNIEIVQWLKTCHETLAK